MYAQSVQFTCAALLPTGKKGVLPKDEYGYRTMPIGALNCFNSAGDYYTAIKAKEIFLDSSAFMRRVKSTCLKSEEGHPMMLPGQDEESFIRRVLFIDPKNVCAHISKVWLDFEASKAMGTGDNRIIIMGSVKPDGPHGAALEESFQNPKEDVCFSIRAFTDDKYVMGTKNRQLVEVVTFDRVGEPGINSSRKYMAPALESKVDMSFSADAVRRAVKPMPGLAMEESHISPQGLLRLLGMQDIRENKPNYMGW